jgi:hypothetical protein
MEGNAMSQKNHNNQKAALGALRIPYVLSKLMIFLFKNNSFGAAGEIDAG